jgi:hypothetical protein
MHPLRHILLALAALAGLPAAALAQQNTFYVESPELGGLKFFLENKGVRKELKLKSSQVYAIDLGLGQVERKYARQYQILALLKKAVDLKRKDPEEYEKEVKKVKKAVANDKMEIMKKNLKENQLSRFKEIVLQVAILGALNQPEVRTKLSLTSDQQEKLSTIYRDFQITRLELREKVLARGKYEQYRKDWVKNHDEAAKKALELLTDDQKKTWESMIGKSFQYKPNKTTGLPSGY